MKSLSTAFVGCLCFYNVLAQRIDSVSVARLPEADRVQANNYLLKARNARTAGLILGIAGGTLAIAGAAVGLNQISKDEWFDGKEPNYAASDALIIVGGVAALASIPCFISVKKNRQKARAIVFANKGVSIAPNITLPDTQSFGVKLAIPIGN